MTRRSDPAGSDERAHRRRLFAHLNGLALVPVAHAMHRSGVTDQLLARPVSSLDGLAARLGANAGYLNVGLRCLASLGYLDYSVDAGGEVRCRPTARSAEAFALFEGLGPLADHLRDCALSGGSAPDGPYLDALGRLSAVLDAGWLPGHVTDPSRERQRLLAHIEGALVGPLLVKLGMNGALREIAAGGPLVLHECCADAEDRNSIAAVLRSRGWLHGQADSPLPTDTGRFFLGRAVVYGVPVSYLPLLTHSGEVMFGDAASLQRRDEAGEERHVDRRMNLWGSSGTHGSYFEAMEAVVVDLFNQPLAQQPAGILDMGCGDGALLARLWRVVRDRTLRGRELARHPLRLFGVDFNAAALEVARGELARRQVPAAVLRGDVGRPDLLAATLRGEHSVDLADLLNVRTFLDHNRPWQAPEHPAAAAQGGSSGAFAHRGQRLLPADVEASLVEHLSRWAPFLRHGLLLVELHTIDPAMAAAQIDRTLAPVYDATHGFSDQYILELPVFERAAAAAGLVPVAGIRRRFPEADWATISLNLLRRSPEP